MAEPATPLKPVLRAREREIVHAVLAPYAQFVERVDVFGSRSLGTARANSDIDLVLHGTLSEAQLARIWTLFDESSLAVTVDVADYGRIANPALKRHIDAVARTLFTRGQLLNPDV